jgi:hypothetical protein
MKLLQILFVVLLTITVHVIDRDGKNSCYNCQLVSVTPVNATGGLNINVKSTSLTPSPSQPAPEPEPIMPRRSR